ncbi:pol-like protein [Apostichopus japonicus]|uniref:Pol-like protein n=1 Tax=Stichopus japonicus TaxID=307972 RepID=A0A2G8KBR0_STIJA|nr:pol-like protein [Apostichopus japonicus]
MPLLASESQTCSVPGRSIHHNLLLCRDIIDYVKDSQTPCALISIDQEKAFDKVNWDFLHRILLKFKLGENFRKWIRILYNGITSRILINGHLSDDVRIKRGVRQGCPLSPSLYVLFIEPLARFINLSKNIRGFTIPGAGGKVVKLLQYADDTTCIGTNGSDIRQFFHAFELFHKATGATINMNKTSRFKAGGFCREETTRQHDWKDTEIKITGVVFGTVNAVTSNWSQKLETAKNCLNAWKSRQLSLIGKVLVLTWSFQLLFGNNATLRKELFLYGTPSPSGDTAAFDRAWFIFTVTKHFMWRSRCLLTFENRRLSDDDVINMIKSDVNERVRADFIRLPEVKFNKVWVKGSSFVSVVNNQPVVSLP